MMEQIEVKVRLLELAAKTYGGVSSMHHDAAGIAKIATGWYNDIESWKRPDTAMTSSTLKVPLKK